MKDTANNPMFKKNIFSFLLIIIIFALDRITKSIIIIKLRNLEEININSFLNLNLIWNEGIAFGLFSSNQEAFYSSLTIIIGLISALIFWFMLKSKSLEKVGFAMILGGSLGNIFDRIYYSSVPDFIDFHYNNFHWFIFNVADIFITLGVMLLIFLELFTKKKL